MVAMKRLEKLQEDCDRHSPLKRCFFHGDLHEVKDGGQKIVLCHYPMHEWNGGFGKGTLHLHGHTHGNIGKSFKERAWDVGVDVWNFEPVTLEEILND